MPEATNVPNLSDMLEDYPLTALVKPITKRAYYMFLPGADVTYLAISASLSEKERLVAYVQGLIYHLAYLSTPWLAYFPEEAELMGNGSWIRHRFPPNS